MASRTSSNEISKRMPFILIHLSDRSPWYQSNLGVTDASKMADAGPSVMASANRTRHDRTPCFIPAAVGEGRIFASRSSLTRPGSWLPLWLIINLRTSTFRAPSREVNCAPEREEWLCHVMDYVFHMQSLCNRRMGTLRLFSTVR